VMAEYMEKDVRFQYHHRPDAHKPGGNGARNYGFEVSSGEYVNWFDSDDLMHPEKLSIQIRLLIKTHKTFCVCQTLIFNENIENIIGLRKKHIYSKDPLNDFIRSKITWLTQAPIILKSFLLDKNLKFNEDLLKAQEYEFFIRLLYHDSNYAYTDEPLVYLRKHNSQISNRTYAPSKSYSIFRASFNSFKLVENSINSEAKEEFFRRMVGQIYASLENKQIEMATIMKKQLKEIEVSISNQFLFRLGFFLYKSFGTEKILNFMSSKKK